MIKKRYLITKRLFQLILYLLEVVGIAYLLTLFTTNYWPTTNFIDFLERMIIFYTFYQIIVFGILQQLNDIKKDEYLAILNAYKYLEVYNSDKRDCFAKEIKKLIERQLDNSVLNDNDIRQEYAEMKKIFENKATFDNSIIKVKIMKYEHCCEMAVLNWKYSILLRIFK